MKELSRYRVNEWVALKPFIHRFRALRNKLLLFFYMRKKTNGCAEVIEKLRHSDEFIVVTIAFEQVEVIDWLAFFFNKNVDDGILLVADNSRDHAKASKIKEICLSYQVSYVRLPSNGTRHVNRSHSMAMEWVYRKLIKILDPDFFGFIDHDLIPVAQVGLKKKIQHQDFYGLLRPGGENHEDPDAWSLWAGYCFFNNAKLRKRGFSFMYDFSRGLDTGGGNYEKIYRNYSRDAIQFCPLYGNVLSVPELGQVREVQQIDEEWYHIGSVSYNNNIENKIDAIKCIRNALEQGLTWDDLVLEKMRSSW